MTNIIDNRKIYEHSLVGCWEELSSGDIIELNGTDIYNSGLFLVIDDNDETVLAEIETGSCYYKAEFDKEVTFRNVDVDIILKN